MCDVDKFNVIKIQITLNDYGEISDSLCYCNKLLFLEIEISLFALSCDEMLSKCASILTHLYANVCLHRK